MDFGFLYHQETTGLAHAADEARNEAGLCFAVATDHFLRLGSWVLGISPPEKPKLLFASPIKPKRKRVDLPLGYEFIRACTPL